MEVRDAVEADADAMAAVADAPTDAMRGLVHDRTVRVAVAGDGKPGTRDQGESRTRKTSEPGTWNDDEPGTRDGAGADADEPATDLLGFVSYDAVRDAVHVTQLAGEPAALDRLLEEPVGFARREGMAVELVVPDDETATRDAADRAGFDAVGPGPSFAGQETTTYRLERGEPS